MVIELLPMRIKPYNQKYFDNCVDIIESNTPKYILPIEHLAFKNYLLKKTKHTLCYLMDLTWLHVVAME